MRSKLHNLYRLLTARLQAITSSPTKLVVFSVTCLTIFYVGMVVFPKVDTASAVIPDLDDVLNWISLGIAHVTFAISNLLLRVTVFALQFFITLASYNEFSSSPVVNAGWILMRDISNMFFIIAMLVIAFATVLGVESYAMKRTLGKLLLMAVLVNFSKLITQLIIDVAHVFSMTFVNAISATAGGNVINMLKLSAIREAAIESGGITEASEIGVELMLTGIFSIAFAGVAMFIMVMYMVVIIWRTIQLWILMILSPIAFSLQALPATAKYANEWWSDFTKNVLSLPVMVFFMWLAFATLSSGEVLGSIPGMGDNLGKDAEILAGDNGGAGGLTALTLAAASSWTDFAGFLIVVGFLLGGLEQVQKIGVRGADGKLGSLDVGGFAKKALRVGTGVWLASKAAGAVKDDVVDRGKTYGILAKQYIPGFNGRGYFAKSKIRREAAVAKVKERQELFEKQIKSEGPTGLAKKLAPSRTTIAKQVIATSDAERASAAKKKETEQLMRQSRSEKERETYFDNIKQREKAALDARRARLAPGKTLSEKEEYDIKEKVAFDYAQEIGGEIGLAALEANAETAEGDAKNAAGFLAEQYVTNHIVRNKRAFEEEVKKRLEELMQTKGGKLEDISPKQKQQVYQDVAKEYGGQAYSAFLEADKEGKAGKGKTEATNLKNIAADALRVMDNKDAEKVLLKEQADANERIKEQKENKDFEARARTIREVNGIITDPASDRKKVEKATQTLAYTFGAALATGEIDSQLNRMLSGAEKSFMKSNGISLTDPEHFQTILMAKLAGETLTADMFHPTKKEGEMTRMQLKIDNLLGDKRASAMRGLMNGAQTSASTHKNMHHLYAFQVAYDAAGLEHIVASGAAAAGDTVRPNAFVTGEGGKNGNAVREDKFNFMLGQIKSITDVGNGSGSIFTMDENGNAIAVRSNKDAEKLFNSLSRYNDTAIMNLDQGLVNNFVGGNTYTGVEYHPGSDTNFKMSPAMEAKFKAHFALLKSERTAARPGTAERSAVDRKIQAWVQKITGKVVAPDDFFRDYKVNGKSIA